MRKREVVWQTNDYRIVARGVPYDYVCERKISDALEQIAWVKIDEFALGSSTPERRAAYHLWQSVHEANASRPLRLSNEDAEVLAYLRAKLYELPADERDPKRDAAQKLMHRMHMHALGDGGRS